jgi:hypothetical protein
VLPSGEGDDQGRRAYDGSGIDPVLLRGCLLVGEDQDTSSRRLRIDQFQRDLHAPVAEQAFPGSQNKGVNPPWEVPPPATTSVGLTEGGRRTSR